MATKKKHPLSHLIPDESRYENYVSRIIDGYLDLDLLKYAQNCSKNVLLYGPTGPGKTSLVMAYAAKYKVPLVTLQCDGGIDSASIWGMPKMDSDGKVYYQDSELLTAIQSGGCIVYFDEANFLPPKITSAFHQILDGRRSVTILEKGNELVQCGDDMLFVASYNPGYNGTRPLNQAYRNRHSIKIHFDYDHAVESALVSLPALLALAGKLRQAAKDGTIISPTSTNMLIEFEELACDLGIDFAVRNFVNCFDETEQQAVRDLFEIDRGRIEAELAKLLTELNAE